jgi:hypothetical protein
MVWMEAIVTSMLMNSHIKGNSVLKARLANMLYVHMYMYATLLWGYLTYMYMYM